MLPDVALLRIFDLYVDEARIGRRWFDVETVETWSALVHVCQEWRNVVFGSPRRLDLRLLCKARTPVREMLDGWPPLPIAIMVYGWELSRSSEDNIVAALEHNDRICSIFLCQRRFSSSLLKRVLPAMQQPFPALTSLYLHCDSPLKPVVVPASFLGGSAQSLQSLNLSGLSIPGLTKLLLSATHLVRLELVGIPHSRYISPEAMVTCLSVLTRLENLEILDVEFESPRSRPDHNIRRLPSPACILPVLTKLRFKGAGEDLDDLVARIDTPLLDNLAITFHQRIFDTHQLTQFISRTPNFKALDEAHAIFSEWDILVTLLQTPDRRIDLNILCSQPNFQLSSLSQVCSSLFPLPLIHAVESLYIRNRLRLRWHDEIESSQWLEPLRPFTSVKSLYISRKFTPHTMPALQEIVGERVTEVLPALQTLFLEEPLPFGPVWNAIEQFVAARQLSSHPIVVSPWEIPLEFILV
jgi:hypothetical protein